MSTGILVKQYHVSEPESLNLSERAGGEFLSLSSPTPAHSLDDHDSAIWSEIMNPYSGFGSMPLSNSPLKGSEGFHTADPPPARMLRHPTGTIGPPYTQRQPLVVARARVSAPPPIDLTMESGSDSDSEIELLSDSDQPLVSLARRKNVLGVQPPFTQAPTASGTSQTAANQSGLGIEPSMDVAEAVAGLRQGSSAPSRPYSMSRTSTHLNLHICIQFDSFFSDFLDPPIATTVQSAWIA